MLEITHLPLHTIDGRPLVHKYYQQKEHTEGLLIVFPGNHYGVDGPLLYYPIQIMQAAGWDTLAVTYGYQSAMQDVFEINMEDMLKECRLAINTVLKAREYPLIGLIGKSLGACVVVHLCSNEERLVEARAVYLTPPIGTPFFDTVFRATSQPAYLALGTKDQFYQPDSLDALRAARPFEIDVIEDSDHSLGIKGDLEASIAALHRVVTKTCDFIRGG